MRTSTLLSSVLEYTKKLFKNAIFQILSLIVALGSIGITYAAWQTINSSEGAAGQPVTQTLVQKIINNLNDLDTRVNAIESNTTGGTVTGPLRWSSEYNGSISTAWSTCLALTPAGSWRVPAQEELQYGLGMNATLFTSSYPYWSSSLGFYDGSYYATMKSGLWMGCNSFGSCGNPSDTQTNYGNLIRFRCVSNAY